MSEPLISVIIPVYNVEKYLPSCLDSVLAQTWENLEILLIDDGSKDSSGSICDAYAGKDGRVKVYHQENAGVSRARNVGLEQATGEYIGFVDSDDYIEPDFYETLIRNAIDHDVDISYCGIKLVQPDGTVEERFNTNNSCKMQAEDIIKGFFFDTTTKELMYSQCNKIFKREVVSGVCYRPYALGEDILFVFEVLGRCRTLWLEDRTLYHYLRRDNSAMTSSFSDKRMDYITAAQDIVEICRSRHPYALEDALHWAYIHKLVSCRQLICNPEYRAKYDQKFIAMKKELRSGSKQHFAKLNGKRKLDYFLVCYFPVGYKFLKKLGVVK